MKTQLLATFTTKDGLDDIIKSISDAYIIVFNKIYVLQNEDNINEIHANGFKIFPYTINEFSDIKRMIELGVDAIITDYPERVNR